MAINELSKFADALTPVSYSEGERIVTKGDVGEVFYIIQEGTVKCHDIGLGDALRAKLIRIVGPEKIRRDIPKWLGTNYFADVAPAK